MWEVTVTLAITLLFAMQPLLRKLPSGAESSPMLVAGAVLVLPVLLAPGAETRHRFALIA